jgi:DNA-binding response OmpR family regulator
MNDAPIICILDRYQPIVYRELLLSGADFCLIEPLNKMDLLSLITAQMKRYRPIEPEILQIADLSLDTRSKTVTRNGKHIRLKKKEVLLLEYFLKHNNQVLSRSQLISQIWDQSIPPSSNVVDVHISSLRKKIDGDFHPKLIKTVHGFGYKIDEDEVNEDD